MNLNYRKIVKNGFLRRDDIKIINIVFFSVIFAVMPFVTYGQETRTLDGVQYTVIDPVTYAFNADTGKLQVGQRYVIDGQVMTINGARLTLMNVGVFNTFTLDAPLRLNSGSNVTVYIENGSAMRKQHHARLDKRDGDC